MLFWLVKSPSFVWACDITLWWSFDNLKSTYFRSGMNKNECREISPMRHYHSPSKPRTITIIQIFDCSQAQPSTTRVAQPTNQQTSVVRWHPIFSEPQTTHRNWPACTHCWPSQASLSCSRWLAPIRPFRRPSCASSSHGPRSFFAEVLRKVFCFLKHEQQLGGAKVTNWWIANDHCVKLSRYKYNRSLHKNLILRLSTHSDQAVTNLSLNTTKE